MGAEGHLWVERAHVLPRVESARVVLLDAPGGWGKTTFAEQLLLATGLAPVRVRLSDECGTDGLAAALARGLRRGGMADLAETLRSTDPDEQLDGLLGALSVRRDGVALFVDEVHFADHAAADWLRSLADDLAAPHRLVVAGRGMARALTRRLRADMVWVTVNDLRFTAEEVAVVAGLAPEPADQLLRRTDGWPAAVGLAAVSGATDPTVTEPVDTLDRLLDDLLGDDRERMAALALPPLLSPEVCALAAGPRAFERLVESGLPTRASGTWRVLADPVREVLGRGAHLDSEQAAAVASCYDAATAVAFLVSLGELEALATSMAARRWSDLLDLSVGEFDAVLTVLGEQRVLRHPELLLSGARAAELRVPTQRIAWVDRGLAAVVPGPLQRGLRAEQVRDLSRNASPEAITRAEELLGELEPDEAATRGRTLLAMGIAHAWRSTPESLATADRCFTEAAGLFRLLGERQWEAEALGRVAHMVNYHGGRAAVAAEQQAQSLALLPSGSRDWAIALTYYSDILDHLGRSVEAEAAGRDAWEVGRRLGDAITTAYGAWAVAIVRAHVGDLDGTRRWLDEVERNPGNWLAEVSGQEFLAYGADLLGGLGDRSGAQEYRARVAARVGHGGTQALLDVLDGRLEAMYGDPQRAIEIFDHLDGQPYATIRAKWIRVLFRALSAKRLGDRHAATKHIERALELVEQIGVPDIPQRHEPVVVAMLADVWPGGAEESAGAQRRIVLLGGFAVVHGVELVTPAPGNPATLVKLLALRGTLTSEQAIDALWPEADVATGRSRLRNLLHRIRSQSGDLVARTGDALGLAAGVSTDVAQFEAGVAAAFDAPAAERAGLARLALGAYAGDLLPADAYEDWAAGPRERLRRRYLSLVDIVADDSFTRGDVDEGMRLLDLGIECEPLEERRYLVATRALLSAGRRAAAREMVLRGARSLGELGLPLCDELAEIGRSLDVAGAS
ncbi:MAG: BTAD domain-containing putative transcriptional regulator [Ilumatobacteraceae bacterium]